MVEKKHLGEERRKYPCDHCPEHEQLMATSVRWRTFNIVTGGLGALLLILLLQLFMINNKISESLEVGNELRHELQMAISKSNSTIEKLDEQLHKVSDLQDIVIKYIAEEQRKGPRTGP